MTSWRHERTKQLDKSFFKSFSLILNWIFNLSLCVYCTFVLIRILLLENCRASGARCAITVRTPAYSAICWIFWRQSFKTLVQSKQWNAKNKKVIKSKYNSKFIINLNSQGIWLLLALLIGANPSEGGMDLRNRNTYLNPHWFWRIRFK